MIILEKLRDLTLRGDAGSIDHPYLSAASGLICTKSTIYVVADDELHLGVFPADGSDPGILLRLFPGTLPSSKSERKAIKPDLEALTLLPASAEYPHGALLAMGSGSTGNRRMAVTLELSAQGAPCGNPRIIDLTPMFTALEQEFSALNIEGAMVHGDELLLLQRGNNRDPHNAIVHYRLADATDTLFARTSLSRPIAIQRFLLGTVNGIPLCFTDGTALPNGEIVFCAVAEDTDDAYHDGLCTGAAIGIMDARGNVRSVQRLAQPRKIEGIAASMAGNAIRVLLVTDADDARIPAGLFSAMLSSV